MTLKYTYLRGNTIIYQRAVPTDLRGRYPGVTVKHDLKTTNLVLAEKAVIALSKRYETEWDGLRSAPESSPASLKAHADAYLSLRGLIPNSESNDPISIDLLHDYIDSKRQRFARNDEERYRQALPEEYLNSIELEAGQRLFGTAPATLNDALELHLRLHKKRDDITFSTYQRRAFKTLVDVVGDKTMKSFTRADARTYVDASLNNMANTSTIRRRLGVMASVFTTWRLERDPQSTNPFEKLSIAGEGEDKNIRIPFTADELATLNLQCRAKDDDLRWILAMLADTGARLSEIVGLALADIVIDALPHIIIQPRPWRGLKNAFSARAVPLVGAALWAAVRLKGTSEKGQKFAFPRYVSDDECRATAASGALASWLRRKGLDHVPHELRHTMADRLRSVQCPKEIRYAIDGHAAQDVGDDYGTGFGLTVKAEWLEKVAIQA